MVITYSTKWKRLCNWVLYSGKRRNSRHEQNEKIQNVYNMITYN